MLQLLKKIFGGAPAVDYSELVQNGAKIIDVRTRQEYAGGHIKNSINIPLNELNANLKKISKDKPVITCCASGMRSSSARGILKSKGYTEVYNGGGWLSLQSKLR